MYHEEMLGFIGHYVWKHGVFWPVLLGDLIFIVVAVLVTLVLRKHGDWVAKIERQITRYSSSPKRAILTIIVLTFVARAAVLPWMGVPVPVVHDEFSFLLGGDTFASGRITNPTHPMWPYFETFHVNMKPTYQSMYPPAQGLALAAGQLVTGIPWIGVLASVALMCGAFCWMLQGWLPPQWAFVASVFAVLRYAIFSYWTNSYFGGAIAALGGALVLGCLPRLRRKVTVRHSLLFGIGLMLLANSRSMEGVLFSTPIIVALLWSGIRVSQDRLRTTVKLMAPAAAVVAVVAAGMAYYNLRSTGAATTMPYVLNHSAYHITNPFVWQKRLPIPNYRHASMRHFYVYHELPDYLVTRRWDGVRKSILTKLAEYDMFYVWPGLFLLYSAVRNAIRDRELRIVALATGIVFAALLLMVWPAQLHYAAPTAGAFLLFFTAFLRGLRGDTRYTWGVPLSRAIALGLCAWLVLPIGSKLLTPYGMDITRGNLYANSVDRQRLQNELSAKPGKHLVIVHYDPLEVPTEDWIYNSADIDGSKVVWARDIDGVNESLLSYFADRQVWYVDRGDWLHKLYRYKSPEQKQVELARLASTGTNR